MLSRERRIVRPEDFAAATRGGTRASDRRLVVHLGSGTGTGTGPAKAGFVVSKAVGNAVVRNRVKRRLRHQASGPLALLEDGTLVVVRALPEAAGATSAELSTSLARCLDRARAKGASR